MKAEVEVCRRNEDGEPTIIKVGDHFFKVMKNPPKTLIGKKPINKELPRHKGKKTPKPPKQVKLHTAKVMVGNREMIIGEYKTAEEAEQAELNAILALEGM